MLPSPVGTLFLPCSVYQQHLTQMITRFSKDFLFLAFTLSECPGFPPTSVSVFLTLFAVTFPDSLHLEHTGGPQGCVLGSFLFSTSTPSLGYLSQFYGYFKLSVSQQLPNVFLEASPHSRTLERYI